MKNDIKTISASPWLSNKDLCHRFGVNQGTIYRWIKEYGFPKPVKLTIRCSRWRLSEVVDWEKNR